MAKPKTKITTTPKTSKSRGRPTRYTQKIINEICTRIEAGESLRTITKSEHLPHTDTIRRWLGKYDGFCVQYARARESQADTIYEEIQEIERKVEVKEIDPNAGRVLIDSKKWRAGKMKPKVYGDWQRIDHGVTASLEDALEKIQRGRGKV